MANIPTMTSPSQVVKPKSLIITIAIYGQSNFVISQNEYTFSSIDELEKAQEHYSGDAFRKNIEAAGAFVKVDVHKV